MTTKLRLCRQFAHPPEKVWKALTQGEILADWLFPNDFRAELGATFTLRGPIQPHWNGIVRGTVLALEDRRLLRIRWQTDGAGGAEPLDTVVTFTLEPSGSGCLLHLEQDGFLPGQTRNRAGAEAGWPRLLDRLETTLRNRIGDSTCTHE